MIPGKNDEETLYFCKATGQLFDKNGVSSNKQFPTADSDAESEDESERGPEGAFGHFLRQFFIPNWKPKPQSWTELATLYASKQLPGSWESDSEEETEPIESQQITKPKQISNKSNRQCNIIN